MNFDPARSRGYVLAMIFGAPAFDKRHSINKTIGYQYNVRYKLQLGNLTLIQTCILFFVLPDSAHFS